MTPLLISNPSLASRQTLYSYLARLAATWRTDAPGLAYDIGASFKRFLEQDKEALEMLSNWANCPPEVMAEIASWTGFRAGNLRMDFRGELESIAQPGDAGVSDVPPRGCC